MKKLSIIAFALIVGLSSCTSNEIAKEFGGTMTINLPKNEKLINATWKNQEVWYLTRPMDSNETPQTYNFQEKSSWGVLEGTVIIIESK